MTGSGRVGVGSERENPDGSTGTSNVDSGECRLVAYWRGIIK